MSFLLSQHDVLAHCTRLHLSTGRGSRKDWGSRRCGMVLVELALCKASVGRTWRENCFQYMETVMGYGQPRSTGWPKWSELGGGRDVLRWVLDQSEGTWGWKPQYQALPNLGEVLSPPDSMAQSHHSFSPSELLSPRKPTLVRLL